MHTSELSFDRLCAEIEAQTDLLRADIRGADLTTRVPTCPDWNVGQLLRHLGSAHRAAVATVRGEAPPADGHDEWRDVSRYLNEDAAALDGWLADGAKQLADTLRAAGEDAGVANPTESIPQTARFPARRMAYETAIHRADAVLALGEPYLLDPEVAADGLDEWMLLTNMPEMLQIDPERRELLGAGRTFAFQASDAAACWLVDLTGDAMSWRRSHESAAATVRAPLTELLLLAYGRRSLDGVDVAVLGDRQVLEFWLARVPFG